GQTPGVFVIGSSGRHSHGTPARNRPGRTLALRGCADNARGPNCHHPRKKRSLVKRHERRKPRRSAPRLLNPAKASTRVARRAFWGTVGAGFVPISPTVPVVAEFVRIQGVPALNSHEFSYNWHSRIRGGDQTI